MAALPCRPLDRGLCRPRRLGSSDDNHSDMRLDRCGYGRSIRFKVIGNQPFRPECGQVGRRIRLLRHLPPLSLAMDGAKKVFDDAPSKCLYYWKVHFDFPDGDSHAASKYPVQRHSAVLWSLRRVLLQITELTVASHDCGEQCDVWLENSRPISGGSRDVNGSSSFGPRPRQRMSLQKAMMFSSTHRLGPLVEQGPHGWQRVAMSASSS